MPANSEENKLVFVSYAHKNEDLLNRELMPFLDQLELNETIELWHDRLIGVGQIGTPRLQTSSIMPE